MEPLHQVVSMKCETFETSWRSNPSAFSTAVFVDVRGIIGDESLNIIDELDSCSCCKQPKPPENP